MKLVLDGAQTMLARTAGELMAKHDPISRLRSLRDQRDELGYTPELWQEMAELGWIGIPLPEEHGGLGMGLSEVVLITEAMGRALAPEPYISSSVLTGRLLSRSGPAVADPWLSGIVDGSQRLALAYQESGSRYDPSHVVTRAQSATNRSGSHGATSWTLEGKKTQVIDGFAADGWIVSARTSGDDRDAHGITLFLLPADRAGVECTRQWRVDSRNVGILRLDGVQVGEGDVIGKVDDGQAPLAETIDAATVALCGEMLGSMREAFERTLEYLKEREQFGVPIGSFQALQHRAAKLFIEVELSSSSVMAAARAIDEGLDDAQSYVSNAKARCSDALIQVTNEALQMHGGIGMTDEHDIGLFMKRARVAEMTFGDATFHRDRFATSRGF